MARAKAWTAKSRLGAPKRAPLRWLIVVIAVILLFMLMSSLISATSSSSRWALEGQEKPNLFDPELDGEAADGSNGLRLASTAPTSAGPPAPTDKGGVSVAKPSRTDEIAILMASYRDQLCRECVLSAYERADHPERVRFFIFQQHDREKDYDCNDFGHVCPGDHKACAFHDRVNVTMVPYTEAKGPTWGRAMQDRMIGDFSGFAMQIDAHMAFRPHWDTIIVDQWFRTNNEMAVLTTYVKDQKASMQPNGEPKDKNLVFVCETKFVGAHEMPRHQTGGIVPYPFRKEHKDPASWGPVLQPVWAAGLSFSRAHRVRNVPYDPYLHMLFDGEEFSMGARLWTNQYDMYTPAFDIVFHPYGRQRDGKPQPVFNQLPGVYATQKRASYRLRSVLGMPMTQEMKDEAVMTEIDTYGVGSLRKYEDFLAMTGQDPAKLSSEKRCHDVYSGKFHNDREPELLGPSLAKGYKGPGA